MSESVQPGLINLGQYQFEFDAAHAKCGVCNGPLPCIRYNRKVFKKIILRESPSDCSKTLVKENAGHRLYCENAFHTFFPQVQIELQYHNRWYFVYANKIKQITNSFNISVN